MELWVLDTNFKAVAVLDTFESLIWTDRYTSCGDFEIYIPMDMKYLEILKRDYYLAQRNSEHMMIIDRIEIESAFETGMHLIVTGKSLEYILERRIVWDKLTLEGTFFSCVRKLLNESIITPSSSVRKIPNFHFKVPTDQKLLAMTYSGGELFGENLYDVIQGMCDRNKVGFKVTLNENNEFIFELYLGTDRSYEQLENPYVIFSPKFDNMISSEYFESSENYRTTALILGEDEHEEEKNGQQVVIPQTKVSVGETVKGLARREILIDARDVPTKEGEDRIPINQYYDMLFAKGRDVLKEYQRVTSFTGEADVNRSFKYGTDYFMGDIVQVEDDYGHDNRAYVTELIFSQDDSGYNVYPTFQVVNEEVIEDGDQRIL